VESLNGKWKMLIEGSRTPALGSNALLMAALMGELRSDTVKQALEEVKVRDVETWTKGNCSGRSSTKNPGFLLD
jgi:hypothetical protein